MMLLVLLLEEVAMLEVVVGVVIEDLTVSINHYELVPVASMQSAHAVWAERHTNESVDSKNLRKAKAGVGLLSPEPVLC